MCTLRSGSRKTPSLGLPRHPGEGRDDGRPPAVTKEAGADDCPGLLSRLRRPNLEMQNDCSRWTQALEIVEGVDSQTQAKPGGAGEALEADIVGADFNAHAVDLVAIIVEIGRAHV